MTNIVDFNDYPKGSAKQWKQRLQFELQGADYNKTLILKTHEEVSLLPFYTCEQVKSNFPVAVESQPMIFIYAVSVEKAMEEILFWTAKSVSFFLLRLHSLKTDWKPLFDSLPTTNYYFFQTQQADEKSITQLNEHIQKSEAECFLVTDYVARFAQTGSWFSRQNNDFRLFDKTVNEKPCFWVDTSVYQNAGASILQQIAYGISHAVTYLNRIEKQNNKKAVTLYFKADVGISFWFEIAKLRALREVGESVFAVYPFAVEVRMVSEPSVRSLSLSPSHYNSDVVALAYQTAILGGADLVLPQNPKIWKKTDKNNIETEFVRLQNILKNSSSEIANGSFLVETLTTEFAQKALQLFKNIESSGGLLEQLKKHIIQKKIKEKATQETADLYKKINDFDIANIVSEADWERYPFVKKKSEKTHIEPLIPYRVWEEIDKKYL